MKQVGNVQSSALLHPLTHFTAQCFNPFWHPLLPLFFFQHFGALVKVAASRADSFCSLACQNRVGNEKTQPHWQQMHGTDVTVIPRLHWQRKVCQQKLHGRAWRHFFGGVNESEPKRATLVFKTCIWDHSCLSFVQEVMSVTWSCEI